MHMLGLLGTFTRPKWQISLPFQVLQQLKSLTFQLAEAWKKNPFRAEPPHISHHWETPPLPPRMNNCCRKERTIQVFFFILTLHYAYLLSFFGVAIIVDDFAMVGGRIAHHYLVVRDVESKGQVFPPTISRIILRMGLKAENLTSSSCVGPPIPIVKVITRYDSFTVEIFHWE